MNRPHCNHMMIKNGFNPSGSQKYLGHGCHRVTTPHPTPTVVEPDVTRRALQLVVDGTGFRAAARQVGVAHSAVLAWFKDLTDDTPPLLPNRPALRNTWSWMNCSPLSRPKNEVFVMTVVERETRCILGWRAVTRRTEAVTQQLIDEAPYAF